MGKVDTSEGAVLGLVRTLAKGVEFERYGDMEPDIFSANEAMTKASKVVRSLSCKLSAREDVIKDLRTQLAEARDSALEEAAKVLEEGFDRAWSKQVAIAAENARDAAFRDGHKWKVACREGVRAALRAIAEQKEGP